MCNSNEAAGIPTLLVAPKPAQHEIESPDRSIYEDGIGDSRGFYSEGAYVGASIKESSDPTSGNRVLREAQEVYFETLLKRFHKLHDQLSTRPPQIVIDGLSSNHPSFMTNSREDLRSWRWRLFNTDPQPAQLAIMDKGTVFKLLRLILTNNGALGGKTLITSRLSRWIWGLLAKVPVSGELMSEEVGLIRELGKRAVWLGVEMRGVDIRELYREENDGDDDEKEVIADFDIDDGNDVDSKTVTDGGRIIGPIMPSREEASSDGGNAGVDATEENAFITPPIVYNSRAEAIQAQQADNGTNAPVDGAEERETGEGEEDQAQMAAMKERLLAGLSDENNYGALNAEALNGVEAEPPQKTDYKSDLDNAKITVDMIITIAGEVYGQRDLLEFREEWE